MLFSKTRWKKLSDKTQREKESCFFVSFLAQKIKTQQERLSAKVNVNRWIIMCIASSVSEWLLLTWQWCLLAWWAAGEADEQTQSDVTGDVNVLSHYLNDETIFPAQFEINTNILFSITILWLINFHHRDIVKWNTDSTLLRFLEPFDSLLLEMTIPQHPLITLVKWIWPIRYHEKRLLMRNLKNPVE